MSEISVTVNGSTTINPTVGNGDTVNVTFSAAGERGPKGDTGVAGPANTIAIGKVVTGTDAAATLTGVSPSQTLNLTLPQGAVGERGLQGEVGPAGPVNSLSIGTVTKGDNPAATITGTAPSQVLSLTLPKGDRGDTGAAGPYTTIQVGTVATGAPGTQAKIDSLTSGNTVSLSFTIPRGVDGTANLADETPQPLGVASAGTAGFAARADHVHAVPTISYANLTNVPTTFAPATHQHAVSDVTGLQAALDGKQASGTYATLVNGLVPSSQLPGFVDDVVEFAALANFPATGEVGKLFVARDTNKVYRWSGTAYIEISASPGSTDSVAEGSTNLYFTTLRASAAAPVQSVNGKTGNVTIEAGGIAWSTAPTTTKTTTKAGQISYDENFLYVANAVDQWRRTSLEDWTTPTITISVQPSNQTAVGGTATFAVTATASQNAELTYQWQRQAGGAGAWVNIGTGLSATLGLADLSYATNSGDKYRVVISSGAAGTGGTAVNGWLPAVVVELTPTATVTSGEATLTVSAAISIITQPQNVNLTNGTSASFSVSATTPGTGLAYQWQSSPDGTNWTNISGATSASYALTGITETGNDNYRYRCIVSSSGYADATSNAALLDVAPITVTSQPSSATGSPVAGTTPNYSASFSAAATSPAGSPTIQWEVSTDGGTTFSDVSGQTNSSLSLTGLTNADTGKRYRAKFEKSGWNTVRSSVATLTVPLDAITVTQQPSNTTASVSSFATSAFALPAGRWNRVSNANGLWFATPSNLDFGGDYIATSADGVNWTRTNLALPAVGEWSDVLYYGGVYLTYRTTSSTVSPRYATSTDGVTWTARNSTVLAAAIGNAFFAIVVHTGVGFVVISSQGASSTAGAVSSDGVTWAARAGGVGASWFDSLTVGNRTVLAMQPSYLSQTNQYQFDVATIVGDGAPVHQEIIRLVVTTSYNVRLSVAGGYIVHNLSVNGGSAPRLLSYANESATTPTTVSFAALPGSSATVAVLPASPRWAAVGNAGFYTSNDQGQTWALRQSTTIGANGNGRFYVSGSRIAFTNFPSSATIYTSDDGGLSWTTRVLSTSGSVGPTQVGLGRIFWQSSLSDTSFGGTIINLGGSTSATFSSSATTTFGAPSIQWQQSSDGGATWTNISSATSSSLALSPVSGDSGKRYRAVFTKDSYTTVNSNAAILTVP
jgi:hypothetical protein